MIRLSFSVVMYSKHVYGWQAEWKKLGEASESDPVTNMEQSMTSFARNSRLDVDRMNTLSFNFTSVSHPQKDLAMSAQENFAIQAVLTYVDTHPLRITTSVDRLKCLKDIYAKLPHAIRHVLRDHLAIYVRLERVLENPENMRTGFVVMDEPAVQRLFAQGHTMLAHTYLKYLSESSDSFSERHKRGKVSHDQTAQSHNGKRKAASYLSEESDLPTAKCVKLRSEVNSDRLSESYDSRQSPSTSLLAEKLLGAIATSPVECTPTSTVYQGADEIMREAFQKIDQLVRKAHLHAFSNQQGKITTQLATKDDNTDLQNVYQHAFGQTHWKRIAVELQSTDTLPAENFLQCTIWASLQQHVFGSDDVGTALNDLSDPVGGSAFLVSVIDAAGSDGDGVLRDAISRRLDDTTLCEKVIEPLARMLAHKLMSLWKAHLPQPLSQRIIEELTRLARDICRASLRLMVRNESVDPDYHPRWYTRGDKHHFVEDEMEHLPNQYGSMVTFTLTPGLQRGTGPMHVVVCPARVNTFDAHSI